MSRERGVDLSVHRSRLVEPADLTWADVVVVMDRHNWQALRLMGAPTHLLVWLGALDGGSIEIPDPYSLDVVQAHVILSRLEDCTLRLAALLDPKGHNPSLPI
jgi:protein-tyrosine-phosphatase